MPTLNKFGLEVRDAAAFLESLYINSFSKLAVGKCSYALMLRENGIAVIVPYGLEAMG
ncbi:hypothetical protein [Bradyrhizobium yuanmingense]|uniref:hypothetical protein n=1 Tax=Bradyrhizobium yuanmingense TaxID=108015 RepID=UPI001FD8EADE|nr:hypothetical protein [Bradyrhizobium yuanmingense]